jgi:hypothetical protein
VTKARIPKSPGRESSHAWFGSGGRGREAPAHRNLGGPISSVSNRANDSRRISPDERIWRDILGDN